MYNNAHIQCGCLRSHSYSLFCRPKEPKGIIQARSISLDTSSKQYVQFWKRTTHYSNAEAYVVPVIINKPSIPVIIVSQLPIDSSWGSAYSNNNLKYQTSRSSFLNTFCDHSRPSFAIVFACRRPASS